MNQLTLPSRPRISYSSPAWTENQHATSLSHELPTIVTICEWAGNKVLFLWNLLSDNYNYALFRPDWTCYYHMSYSIVFLSFYLGSSLEWQATSQFDSAQSLSHTSVTPRLRHTNKKQLCWLPVEWWYRLIFFYTASFFRGVSRQCLYAHHLTRLTPFILFHKNKQM